MWPLEEPLEGSKKWLLVLKSKSVTQWLMAQERRVQNHLSEKSPLDQIHNSMTTLLGPGSWAPVRDSASTYTGRACAVQRGSPLTRLQTVDTQVDNNLKRTLFFFLNRLGKGTFHPSSIKRTQP